MSSLESVLKSQNKYTDELTDYVNELKARAGGKMLDKFAEMRKFSLETIKENDIFYIGDATEMLIPCLLNPLCVIELLSHPIQLLFWVLSLTLQCIC